MSPIFKHNFTKPFTFYRIVAINFKSHKRKTTRTATIFVTHNRHVNNFSKLFHIP